MGRKEVLQQGGVGRGNPGKPVVRRGCKSEPTVGKGGVMCGV